MADLIDRLHEKHHYSRQHLKVTSDRKKVLGIPGRRRSLAVSPNLDKGKVACAATILERPIQVDHPGQRRDLPDPPTSQGEDDGTPGQIGAISRRYSLEEGSVSRALATAARSAACAGCGVTRTPKFWLMVKGTGNIS
jgi:hypothetical protein